MICQRLKKLYTVKKRLMLKEKKLFVNTVRKKKTQFFQEFDLNWKNKKIKCLEYFLFQSRKTDGSQMKC